MEPLKIVSEANTDDKYIVFKAEDFFQMMGYLALPPWKDEATGELLGSEMDCAPLAASIQAEVEKTRLKDAVVIRRQDLFASPALATYASCIAMVANALKRSGMDATELLKVADYFQRQSELAADEGWKYPDV